MGTGYELQQQTWFDVEKLLFSDNLVQTWQRHKNMNILFLMCIHEFTSEVFCVAA